MKYYWNRESWGAETLPDDADEIIETANALIDEFIEGNPDADEREIEWFSEKLWDDYCNGRWV